MLKDKFRKFMVKYIIGINGTDFIIGEKTYTLSWIKGGPYFFIIFVLMGVFSLIVKDDTTKLIVCLPITAIIYILGFWYPITYPLTEEEANEFEKRK